MRSRKCSTFTEIPIPLLVAESYTAECVADLVSPCDKSHVKYFHSGTKGKFGAVIRLFTWLEPFEIFPIQKSINNSTVEAGRTFFESLL
jgi:hypothetical protein